MSTYLEANISSTSHVTTKQSG